MDKHHAEQIHNAVENAKTHGQDFVNISAPGMLCINVPIANLRMLESQAYNWTRQLIRTRFHGPTDTKGARISARYAGGSIFVGYAYELSPEGNHRSAAQALAEKLNWGSVVDGGAFDSDYYWICSQNL